MRTQHVLCGVARWRRSAIVLASPQFLIFETKFYKTAGSGNTPKEPRCYLPLIRAEPPKQFGQGPVRTDSQNRSSAPGRPFLFFSKRLGLKAQCCYAGDSCRPGQAKRDPGPNRVMSEMGTQRVPRAIIRSCGYGSPRQRTIAHKAGTTAEGVAPVSTPKSLSQDAWRVTSAATGRRPIRHRTERRIDDAQRRRSRDPMSAKQARIRWVRDRDCARSRPLQSASLL